MPPELQPMNVLPSTSVLINPGITTVQKAELDDMVDDDDGPPLLDRVIPSPQMPILLPSIPGPPSLPQQFPSTSYSSFLSVPPPPRQTPSPQQNILEAIQLLSQPSPSTNSLLYLLHQQQKQQEQQQQFQQLWNLTQLMGASGSGMNVKTTEPSISIEIKETNNSFLENLIAEASGSQGQGRVDTRSQEDKPVTPEDVIEQLNSSQENCTDCPDLPPNLEKVESTDPEFDLELDDEEPPELERVQEGPSKNTGSEDMAVLRSQTPQQQLPKKSRKSSSQKSSTMKKKKSENNSPPALDYFKPSQMKLNRESSTSSGVSSLDDCESPGCSPLAPINGNSRRSSRLQNPITPPKLQNSKGRKRKSESPIKEDKEPAKKKSKQSKNIQKKKTKKTILSNWIPVGKPFAEYVHVENESAPKPFCCYPAVKHRLEQIVFHNGDVICVSAGEGEPDNIGKINRIFRDKNGNMAASVFWYYRYDQCILKQEDKEAFESRNLIHERELMASRHLDTISCDSIQSHAFVLTFSEYCRHVAENKFDLLPPKLQARCIEMWSRGEDNYPRRHLSPHEDTVPELVFFCRRYYSLDKKKIFNGFPSGNVPKRRQSRGKGSLIQHSMDEDIENQFSGSKPGKRVSV